MLVSVIILNKDGGDHFKKCINSVLSSTYQNIEILVRENSSKDGSLGWLRSLNNPKIRVIERENTGNFSTMNNEIAKLATGDLLLFLNNDVFLDSSCIQNMVDLIVSDQDVGMVGTTLRYPSGKLQHAGIICGPSKDPINLSEDAIRVFKVNQVFLSDIWEHKAITAASCLIRRHDFFILGGFDPQFNWAYEDVDLSLKVHYHLNKKNVVSPMCTGIHIEGASHANPDLSENLRKFQLRWTKLFTPDFHLVQSRRYGRSQPKEISFIVCTNDFEQLNDILVKSLYPNRHRYELIPIYNFDGTYSAPQALNLGASRASCEWLVFTHQDVEYSKEWIDKVFSEVRKCQKLGVAGMAGVKVVNRNDPHPIPINNGKIHINCIGGVKTPEQDGKLKMYGQMPAGEVDVVDELCVITKKSNNLLFDEKNLNHFHFYAVDLSLLALSKGFKNYVLDANATHHSNGASSLSKGRDIYWREFKKVHQKWKSSFPTVVTTTGFWSNDTIQTFYKDEVVETKTTIVQSSKTAQTLQMLTNEAVELKANEEGDWLVNGVSMKAKTASFLFKPQFQGLHKVSHQAKNNSSEWWIHTINPNSNYVAGMSQSFHTHQLGEIFGTKHIIQEVICDRSNLSRVDLFVGTFRRKNDCTISLHIEDENGTFLRASFLDSGYVRDNDWNEFIFEQIPDSRNRKLRLKIFSPDASPNNAMTVYYVNHVFSFGNLFQNQRKIAGCLSFKLFYGS